MESFILLRSLSNSCSFKKFEKELKGKEHLLFESLWDVPKALLAAYASHITGKSIVLITGGMREDRFAEHLETFSPRMTVEFPSWETLPGEEILPSPDILGKRFSTLFTLLERKKKASIVLLPLQALLQKVIAKEELSCMFLTWKKGMHLAFSTLPEILTNRGYRRVPLAADRGEFAVRGGILDIFPTNGTDPYRIDFFGSEIEEIRTYDPIGQKSIGTVSEITICPAQELFLLQKSKKLGSILDYLEPNSLIFWDDLVEIEDSYVAIKAMKGSHSPFFYSFEEMFEQLQTRQNLFFAPKSVHELGESHQEKGKTFFEVFHKSLSAIRVLIPIQRPLDFFNTGHVEQSSLLELLPKKLENVTFFTSSASEEEDLRKKLASHNITCTHEVSFEQGFLASGFSLLDLPWTALPYAEFAKKTHIRREKWRSTTHTSAFEFHHLSPGDLVVHFHSGVGKFLGIEKHVNHLKQETEFLILQYAEESKLFVPMSQAYLVSRYIGSYEQMPSLSQLGGKRWQATKVAAQQQILGYAHELLRMYAERAVKGGFVYPEDGEMMHEFEENFPYTETSDQISAIAQIKEEMQTPKSMDRLICGDVGYGKTEVAMRAAFKAVVDGHKQVAVLVPTTVLAMQHFETFCERMRGFPVKVACLSRLSTAKQNRCTLTNVGSGDIDILIGTHRILSQDVFFKDLGLIIIDEEQRFGVKAKEQLKHLKAGVDCLTLSATPIPRTLYMSLVHARDMSVIGTPPQDRLPIKTIIAETDSELIQNALLREFARGGQAFYIHNRVESIYEKAHMLEKLIPTAKIGIVHGQMCAEEAGLVFHRFKENELDLLLATTIVENGIDVPNANTILIEQANTFGMADLYQLRGRVGRWNRAAYAYFLVPKKGCLSEVSRKRLNALAEAGGYGGGIKLAMRDLEMRGAGDLLGIQQSGQVSAIGFHLYCKLLKKAIDALKKQAPINFQETKLEFPFDAKIPESYVDDVGLRMELYYRFGEASQTEDLDDLMKELKDRFGEPPISTLWLYYLSRIRVFASAHKFTQIKFQNFSILIERQKGDTLEQKTIALPQKMLNSPQELEKHLISQLLGDVHLYRGKFRS